MASTIHSRHPPDSPYAAMRLGVTLLLMTLSASGMYIVPVVLPAVQAEFGIASRLISGYICDRIGGLRTLLLGSA